MRNRFLRRIRRHPWPILAWAVLLLLASAAMLFLRRGRPLVIAVIPRTCGTYLWEAEHAGVARAARTYGFSIYWNAPMREDDVQGQIDILTRALDRKMRGLIVSPVEALPLRTPVRNALSRGVPVVVVGTDLGLTPCNNLAYVLNDERQGGQMAARRVGRLLHGRGTVAIVGIRTQLTSTAERARSLETTLASEFPDIHIVFRSLALPTVSQEQHVAERLLVEDEQVDAIVALTEEATRGSFYALMEFNRSKTTPLIGFDQNVLAPIRTGDIDSVIIQNTNRMGAIAAGLVNEELHGGAKHAYVVVEPLLVTRENIDSDSVRKILDLEWYRS